MIKPVISKSIEVYSNGALNFSRVNLKANKQIVFHKKSLLNVVFVKRSVEKKLFPNTSHVSYKSRYKF